MKRIIQTYKAPHQWTNSPPGIGDFIRGSCHLFEKLQGSGVEFRIDISQTGFSDLIEQDPSVFQTGAEHRIAAATEYFEDHVALHNSLVAFLNSDETDYYVCTNLGAWNRLTLPESTRGFIQNFYHFSEQVESLTAQALQKTEYEVLSIRCGDHFYNDPNGVVQNDVERMITAIMEQQILPRARLPVAVTSDCHELKCELARRYGLLTLPHRSQHGAFGTALPVAMDLCMLKNSRTNYHINCWAKWWSGFSHYTSVIFQIPSVNFRTPHFVREEITAEGQLIKAEQTVSNHQKLLKAIEWQGRGQWLEASWLLREILLAEPNNAAALYSLGAITAYSGHLDEALLFIEQGIQVAPGFTPLHIAHGELLRELGHNEEALRSYDNALKLQPDYIEALFNSGVLLMDLLRHYEAFERFKQVLSIDPNHPAALVSCAAVLLKFKQGVDSTSIARIIAQVDNFFTRYMQERPWVGVHVCDSDKIHEPSDFFKVNANFISFIDRIIELNSSIGIFLIADSLPVLEGFKECYGLRVLCAQASLAVSRVEEVLRDVLLALKCTYFVGNQESNISLAIANMRNWPQGFIFLLSETRQPYPGVRPRVLFFNDWNNGDVHMSRPYVVDLMKLLGDCDYYYYHRNNPKLLADIDNLIHTTVKIDADVVIDTWLGQSHFKGMDLADMAKHSATFKGANFPNYHEVMSGVYATLGLTASFKPAEYYLPTINYARFDIGNVDRYFAASTAPLNVLICNNETMSGQAPPVDFNAIVVALADRYPTVEFLISNVGHPSPIRRNVVRCSNIIARPEMICDLNEISYISTHCDLIVGRSSGPYSFSITKENLQTKQFICICRSRNDCWFLESSTNITWTNDPSTGHLISLLSKSIATLMKDTAHG